MQSDIKTLADVHQLVHTFYGLIREEPLLGPVFEERIQDNWPEHLEKMVRFWQTVLLEERTYFGSPFPHMPPYPYNRSTSNAGYRYSSKQLIIYLKVKMPKRQNYKVAEWLLCFRQSMPIIKIISPFRLYKGTSPR